MSNNKVRVGIIGLTPGRSWADVAHLPALKLLPDRYEIVGVANSSPESTRAAATARSIPIAFDSVDEMAASEQIDLMAVTVKVPHHDELVRKSIAAGKSVFCEWPLGNGLQQSRELAAMAHDAKVAVAIGTQARVSPVMQQLGAMIRQGVIGEVLSSTMVGTGLAWGPSIEPFNTYLYDVNNGATMLTIPVGHTLAAVMDVLGPVQSVMSMLSTRRRDIEVVGSGETLQATAPDDVIVAARMSSGVPLSIRYCGGTPSGTGFLWEIHGSRGSLQVTGPGGHTQLMPLALSHADGVGEELQPVAIDSVYLEASADDPVAGNVARIYARLHRSIKGDVGNQPDFDDALKVHQVIDAIDRSAATGQLVDVLSST